MTDLSTCRPIVFAYNFPHKKTQDFLQRLLFLGAEPALVLLADPVRLDLPQSHYRVKPKHVDLLHPQAICRRFNWRYEVVDHASQKCIDLLDHCSPQIGVIAGSRILPKAVIECFSVGIMNFHPGLIPEVRGLNALQWALRLDLPLGVTAHLIDHRVDAGRIVERRLIDEFPDDTLIDLSLRLAETQVQMLSSALEIVATCDPAKLKTVDQGEYRHSLPSEWSSSLPELLARRLKRIAIAA